MQNSVAPVAAVSTAALTSDGMSSQARAHGGGEQPGLRAEVAVLGAAAGLEADDALDLHLGAAVAHAHLVGELQQLGQALVRQPQAGQRLLLGQADAALEHLLACGLTGRAQWSSARSRAQSLPGRPPRDCHALVVRPTPAVSTARATWPQPGRAGHPRPTPRRLP